MHVVKDSTTSARFTMARNVPRIEIGECEENEFVNLPLFSPSRAPLHSIPDPSQLQKAIRLSESDLVQKFEGTKTQIHRTLGPEKRFEVLETRAGNASGMHDSNPKSFSRNGKSRSEPNSAQSTPTRNGARVSLGGGCATGTRVAQSFGGRGMSSFSRIPRGISMVDPVCYAETPHFELNEDHSFWKEHNVQVLIRIRPLSTMERATQGYGKCLKQESPQTLVWLGHPETRFTFDHVASEAISQENLFRIAGLPMVENCLSGYNSCVFAYGQTGSGKTYTMMGEIPEAEGSLNEDCGVTARIFEYLFSRIKMEEEGRRDEKLKFSCKCSFLEIYNEQITDLLEPSSTNLQLREDLGKGVYVENLVEYNVNNVNDVLKLLLQGAANRKIAATHMNSESSRSHSVFTCTIESLWERDSLTHFRFARLNLVDLAGSERQKSSGAEGDRLKEAANINKSLSTLGLVIMSLVDLAHGKHRHVPYRDSRLTFLLQDSLGGNSKTMIIANVSPSTCSTNETLSTLKFAQRAKLIQNNAKGNEDASGDVTALQQEIRKLKVQLSSLMKNQNSCGTLSDCITSLEESKCSGTCKVAGETIQDKCHCQMQNTLRKKVKTMKDILIGALRREKIAGTALQKSEAEIERIDSLARDMEEDVKRIKVMLSFREGKVGEMESSLTDSLTTKDYLIEENNTLKRELTRSALENTKLREQLRRYQNFYEHGERELLLAEVAGLRDQVLDVLGAKEESFTKHSTKENEVDKELEDCRNMNSSLIRELDEIQAELGGYMKFDLTPSDFVESSTSGAEQAETMPMSSAEYVAGSESKDCSNNNNESGNRDDNETWLIDESQNILEENERSRKMLTNKSNMEREAFPGQEAYNTELSDMVNSKDASMKPGGGSILPSKLEKLIEDLKEARTLNCKYEKEYESHLSQQQDIEAVREQVETETARTILELQEEVIDLQSDFQIRICNLIHENKSLKDTITAREAEMRTLNQDWEKATLELTNFIVDGSKSIKDASVQIESIICSFPHVNAWIGDYVEKAAKVCIKKEETILLLQKSLEDARILLAEMDLKLNSLKGATIALNEFQLGGNAVSTEEAFCLNSEIDRMSNEVDTPESDLKAKQYSALEAERRAEAAFSVKKWLSDSLQVSTRVDINRMTCSRSMALKGGHDDFQILLKPVEPCKPRTRNQHPMMENVNDQPAEESGTLSSTFASPNAEKISDTSLSKGGYSSEAAYPKDDKLSTSSSDLSNHRRQPDWILSAKCQGGPCSRSDAQEMHTSAALISEDGSVYVDYGERMKAAERPLTIMMERAETECKCSNAPSSEVHTGLIQRMDFARSFFQRFEAVNATMKEADLTICELVDANEKSKHVIGRWCQTQDELMTERKFLMADFEHIKSTLSACEQENQILLNQTQSILVEMENSVSLLEENFQETKRGVGETLEALFSNVLLAGKELLHLIFNSKPSVEQIVSETMEREFTMYATYQCHIGKLIDQILDQGKQVTNPHSARQENLQPMEMNAIGYSAEDEVTRRLNGAYRADFVKELENEEAVQSHESLIYENLYLKKELERKEALFEGLLFDFRLLQESASNKRDIKDETDELIDALCKVQQELDMKASQVHDLSIHIENLENLSNELQTALFTSKSDLKQEKERIQILEEQNNALGVLVRDLCLEKAAAEEKLEEQNDLVKSLEKEILHLTTTAEKQLLSSVKTIEENLRNACEEKNQLVEEIRSLNDKLELAYAIVDEKEAATAEARQESEASKIYAEQKEEEVSILETSVEELERTVNILEGRVYDMDEEVKRHRTTQESLETELQALRQRLLKFENFNGTGFSTNESAEEYESQTSRSKELQDAHCQIQVLQKEVAEQNKEIKQLKDYIAEILLHSEAQASAYQEKYKTLEAMVRDFKSEESSSSAARTMSHKTEKSAIKSRGSSSPFRCLVGMVQQMNLEKDQELTMSRLRVEELESLVAAKQKEVCTLKTRIAAADSMTHDVIRDLLGVKMDITSYADLVDQHQVQKVVEEAHEHAKEILSKEQEIINLKKHIDALVKERESCMSELNKKDTDVLATQISLDQLQERVQLLYMQNEMLKNDKSNLLKRVAELDRTVRDAHTYTQHVPQTTKDSVSFKLADTDYTKRLENAQKLLFHANNELAKYRKTSNNHPSTRTQGQSSSTRYR